MSNINSLFKKSTKLFCYRKGSKITNLILHILINKSATLYATLYAIIIHSYINFKSTIDLLFSIYILCLLLNLSLAYKNEYFTVDFYIYFI